VVLWHIGPAPTRVVDRNGYRRFDEPMSSPEVLFDRLFDRVKTTRAGSVRRVWFRQEGGAYRPNGTRCKRVIDGTWTVHDMAFVAASWKGFWIKNSSVDCACLASWVYCVVV
jgi:hypothetical protein